MAFGPMQILHHLIVYTAATITITERHHQFWMLGLLSVEIPSLQDLFWRGRAIIAPNMVDDMGQYFRAIHSFPFKEMIGKRIRRLPMQLVGIEMFQPAPLKDSRQ